MDMSHGCPHFVTGGCSFCTEPLFGMPAYRNEGDIIAEMKALLNAGCTNFRLGGQSCIFSYKAMGVGEVDRPKPNVKALGGLFDSIAKLRGIKVLHTDNADPAAIAAHPDESARILEMIVSTCTSGNILSMGIESADPLVAEKNNLNSTAAEALAAIRLVNKAGSEVGPTGLPKLLPGLNFLGGLDFETPETFELNKRFLCEVLDSGLMLRRINIRQVSPVRRDFGRHNNKKEFIRFKEFVRGNIDSRMLERVAPAGRVLRAVYTEVPIGKLMFARQIGTYPILIGIPQDIMPGTFLDVMIAAHGSRSLTGLEYPLDINSCQLSALGAIPGIGRKRAIRLFKARPLQSPDAIRSALDDPALAAGVAKHAGL
jgi:radical SAM superfamily enzyme with C-terminal helix-hairpin-helix motif